MHELTPKAAEAMLEMLMTLRVSQENPADLIHICHSMSTWLNHPDGVELYPGHWLVEDNENTDGNKDTLLPYWVAYVESHRDKHALVWAETDTGFMGALMSLPQIWQQGLTLPGVQARRLYLIQHAAALNQGFILKTDLWSLFVKTRDGSQQFSLPSIPDLPLLLKDGFQVSRLVEDDATEVHHYMGYYNETVELMKLLIRCRKTFAVRSLPDASGQSELAAFIVERMHGEIGLLFTKERFRGRGFSKLLQQLLMVEMGADISAPPMYSEVSPSNRVMRRQQIKLGLTESGFSCWVYVGKALVLPQSKL